MDKTFGQLNYLYPEYHIYHLAEIRNCMLGPDAPSSGKGVRHRMLGPFFPQRQSVSCRIQISYLQTQMFCFLTKQRIIWYSTSPYPSLQFSKRRPLSISWNPQYQALYNLASLACISPSWPHKTGPSWSSMARKLATHRTWQRTWARCVNGCISMLTWKRWTLQN
jgi:hypothetical protein